MEYCATNVVILSSVGLAMPLEANPLREVRERLGLTQEELAMLAASGQDLRRAVKAAIAGLEAGVFERPEVASAWHYIKEVFARARFNVRDLEIQYVQWGKDLDESIAEEVNLLVGHGEAKPGPK